ncbi:phosphatase PAP2 family protein [Kitasatospora sp. NPDC094011]|uniref:phosphatase PAP2 family protein n=1 Tax=Kitasatospora sp. NPDC094011 TaxID=3364090 RepID=UPI0038094E9B
MTRHDHLDQAPHRPDATGPLQGTPAGRSPSRGVRPWKPVLLRILGLAAVYLVAVCTPFGQRAENGLINHNGGEPAWIYDWSGSAYDSGAMPPLEFTALPTLVVGTAAIVAVAVLRRCWWAGGAAVGVVLATFGGTEVLSKMALPRPDLVGAPAMLTEASFPSGHAAVPVALVLGAALVASPRVRPYVVAAGMLWLAVTAGAVQALYHHRPSDVLGATLLGCACHGLATRLLPPSAAAPSAAAPGGTPRPRALPAVAFALSAAGALAAGAREDALAGPLVFAAAAFLCALLVWCTAVRGAAPARPRPGREPVGSAGS